MDLRDFWRRNRPRLLAGLVANFVKAVGSTLRISTENWDTVEAIQTGKIICGFHGRSFVASAKWKRKGYWVMISHSRDGEIQTRVFKGLGFKVIRGSTGRGAVKATIEAIKELRGGATMAMTPDGPRGPSGVVQNGVIYMAQKSGAALVPVGIASRPCARFKSWDKYILPCPFAKAIMIFGAPIYIQQSATEEEAESIRLQLENEIHRLELIAESTIYGNTPSIMA